MKTQQVEKVIVVEEQPQFMGSGRFQVSVTDVVEVVKNGAMVALAAFITFLIQSLSNIEMGEGVLMFLPVVTIALNSILNWIKDNTK